MQSLWILIQGKTISKQTQKKDAKIIIFFKYSISCNLFAPSAPYPGVPVHTNPQHAWTGAIQGRSPPVQACWGLVWTGPPGYGADAAESVFLFVIMSNE